MRTFLFILGMLACLQLSAQEAHYATKRNLTYTTSTDAYAQARCKVDVYYPTDAKDCPVVVWFHGGGLTAGQKAIPAKLKEHGMAVVAVNYRLLPRVDINACLDDAAAAVAWTFKEIAKYGGSTRKIFLSGHSAGGYLITMLGLSLGSLLGGTAVVEVIFSYPALGSLAISAITSRDYPLIQGYVLWIALIYMAVNLVVDLSYNRLDPRLRKELQA